MTPQEMGEALRVAREAAGFSQERLAARLGTSRRHYMRWEKGTVVPSAHYRGMLLAALPALSPQVFSTVKPTSDEQVVARAVALEDRLGLLEARVGELEQLLSAIGAELRARPRGR